MFWEYDPRSARRWNVDPKSNLWESPYCTFGGNPIRFTDFDGDEWGDEEKDTKIANEIRSELGAKQHYYNKVADNYIRKAQKISNMLEKVDKANFTKREKLINKQMSFYFIAGQNRSMAREMRAGIDELNEMQEACGMTFTFDDYTQYDSRGGALNTYSDAIDKMIHIPFSNSAGRVHEAKHGYQFLVGTFKIEGSHTEKLSLPGGASTTAYSLVWNKDPSLIYYPEEVAAYRRQYVFDPWSINRTPSKAYSITSIYGINDAWLHYVYDLSGNYLYRNDENNKDFLNIDGK